MNYYNRKCLGCGQYFSNNENDCSYIKSPNEKTKFCKRCFTLRNYNFLDNSKIDNELIKNNLKKIDFSESSIILVVDLFDLKNTILNEFKENKNVLIVINKLNFLKIFNRVENFKKSIIKFLEKNNWKNPNVIFYDAVNKININQIDNWISKQNKKIYVAGKTNVGKSTLINSLLKFNKQDSFLSVSSIKNTTVNLSKIKLKKNVYLIDTPGFENNQNFLSIINSNKKIDFKNFSFKSFFIKDDNQMFFLENFLKILNIEINKKDNSVIQFYLPKNLIVHRTNKNNYEKIEKRKNELFDISVLEEFSKFKKISLSITKNENLKKVIFLNGLGILIIKNINKIEFGISEHLDLEIFDDIII